MNLSVNRIASTTGIAKSSAGQTDQATSGLERARFLQCPFPDGVRLFTFYKPGDSARYAVYDPAQISALDVRLLLNIYADYTEGEQVDSLRELGREAETPDEREVFSILLDQADRSGDAASVVARGAELLRQAMTEGSR
ncbi:hypothetical protein ACFRR6_36355 [Streptomyces sp. NPDC056891]|uniref:hypothetical protein n=1 Tax=Streptomyces sp. NPDC056891 TaxID=3345961 RepID=UPI00369C9C61